MLNLRALSSAGQAYNSGICDAFLAGHSKLRLRLLAEVLPMPEQRVVKGQVFQHAGSFEDPWVFCAFHFLYLGLRSEMFQVQSLIHFCY